MLNRVKDWWQAQGDLAKLKHVSDRMLADMGLEREALRDRVLACRTNSGAQASCACRPTTALAQG
ncbi:MAG: hypothetical protein C0426_09145 [Rhodobacter sp.]|nr:hypothetical protein [Rhodobacter sp.]